MAPLSRCGSADHARAGRPRLTRAPPRPPPALPPRCGDTAANAAAETLLADAGAPLPLRTAAAAAAAGCWRAAIMPLDNVKVCVAVEGSEGGRALLRARVAALGPRRALWAGGTGAAAAHALSYVPWFCGARVPGGGRAIYPF